MSKNERPFLSKTETDLAFCDKEYDWIMCYNFNINALLYKDDTMPYLLHIYSNCYADKTICNEKCIK